MGAGAEGGEYSRAMTRDRLAAVERAHSFPAKVNKVLSDPPTHRGKFSDFSAFSRPRAGLPRATRGIRRI
jgi:hypothetical protein